jgi:hypothetical protein
MKNHITVTVEVEFSASHIEQFTERVSANVQAPLTQAICNVKSRIKDTVENPHLLNYSAH